MNRMELAGIAVEASSGAPLVVLREQAEPHRLLHIFIGPLEAASIATAAAGQAPSRPQTHDLMVTLVESLDGSVEAVEVTELSEGAFLARMTISGPGGEQVLDTRPSDAIAVALRVGAPVLVSDEVLDEAGIMPGDLVDETEIDETEMEEELEEFRSFLDAVDPAAFADETDNPDTEDEADKADKADRADRADEADEQTPGDGQPGEAA